MIRVGGKLCDTGEVVTLTLAEGRIASIGRGVSDIDIGGPDVRLSAGFIDLQLNGYGGHDFNRDAWGSSDEVSNEIGPIFEHAARAGTALLCPTVTTNSTALLRESLSSLDRALEADTALARAVPGIHLEGPYIAAEDGPRGAHPLKHVRDPDWSEFQRLQEAAGGRIKVCTLAPEREGALAFIEKLTESGVTVAIGHTGAEPEQIQDAVRAGARLSTHLGNGAHGMIRRHPNYIWEQLACDDLSATVIADGHHLPASVLKSFVRAKGADRLALVSDAVALGGLAPGIYAGGRYQVLETGKVVLANTPYLAGAGHLLDACVANALRLTDLSLSQATRCVSANPARILGLEARKGRIAVGCDADLTLFRVPADGPLEIAATIRGGDTAYRR